MSADYTIFAQAAAPAAPAAPAVPAEVKVSAAPAEVKVTTEQPAAAANAEEQPQGGFLDGIGGMISMILIIVVMFYLMYRGQKKEQKRRQDMITSIKKDDKIVTIGGLHGTISEVRDDSFKVKIAENTEIVIAKSAVGSVVNPETKA